MLKKFTNANKKAEISLIILGSIFFFVLGLYVGTRDYSKVEALENRIPDLQTIGSDKDSVLNSTTTQEVFNTDYLNLENSDMESCEGTWVNINSTGLIKLDVKSLNDWGADTGPIVISETKESENIVVIGHNICEGGNCFRPKSAFGNLINTKVGDFAELCLDGKLNKGYVVISAPMSEYDVHILSNWLSMPSVTMFTSYGKCKNAICSSTEERWVVAFER